MKLPQLEISSTLGRIGINSERGQFNIRQNRAIMNIQTTRPVMSFQTEPPVVIIDMSRTWDALNGGKPEKFWNRIYSQSGRFVQHAIINTVDEYNRIGDLTIDSNPISDLAWNSMMTNPPKMQIYGEASVNNVSYVPKITDLQTSFERGQVNIQVVVNKPRIEFNRGRVRIYMEQYPDVRFRLSEVDMHL